MNEVKVGWLLKAYYEELLQQFAKMSDSRKVL